MSRRATVGALVFVLLAAFLFQTFSTIRTTAPTYDEVAHLPAGYAQLVTGHPTLNLEHPPLVKVLAATMLWRVGGRLEDISPNWQSLDEWTFGKLFLFGPGRDPTLLINRARRVPIVIGLLLCIVCFAWAARLYGPAGGLFSMTLCVFCPTILAHTRLVTTDVPVATFGVLAAYLAWETMNRPTVGLALLTGLATGAALASKFSGVLFLPALGLAVAYHVWRHHRAHIQEVARTPKSGRVKKQRRRAPVPSSPRPETTELSSQPAITPQRAIVLGLIALAAASILVMASDGWPPSATAYVDGIRHVGENLRQRPAFMLGTFRVGGFATYFPVAFLLKTSPAVLVALALFAALPLLRRAHAAAPAKPGDVDATPFLWLPAFAYAAFIIATAPDLGIRYLIPVYPFLFVALGQLGAALWPMRVGKGVVVALLAVHVDAAVRSWPDPLSYFNGLLGCHGPSAVACLNDSNIDWGQDLGRVADAVNRVQGPNGKVVLSYFGTAEPWSYLNSWRWMADSEFAHPRPELYAISVYNLQWAIGPQGPAGSLDWLTRFHPIMTVGNTFYIYDFRPGR